jgi:hypothetical protein
MPKISLISTTFSAMIFAILLPYLEISETHLFNPDWPAHARFHNAWQLLANASLSILSVILVWKGSAPKVGMGLALIINISLLIGLAAGPLFGGSTILVSHGSDLAVGGINVAAIVIAFSTLLLLVGYRALLNRSEV